MNTSASTQKARPLLDLPEEALHLLRTAPLSITLSFYFGSIPFVLALLFFSMDFSNASYSEAEAALAALGLAMLYAWMKAWQAVFCQQLRAWLCGSTAAPWNTRRFSGIFFQQLILQPTAFIVVPLSLIITLPFAWTYAFYQNISVLGDGSESSLRQLCARSWHQASLWPKQNHLGIWLISPILFVAVTLILLASFYVFARFNPYWMQAPQDFLIIIAVLILALSFLANPCGAVVALNFGIFFFMLPQIFKMLTGIESTFTLGAAYLLSSTFLIMICSLTYLTLEPLVKAFYVLRCFYGDSIRTGEDLKAGLQGISARRLTRVGALLLLFLASLAAAPAQAETASPPQPPPAPAHLSPADLDPSIDRILSARKYDWRSPHEVRAAEREKGLFGHFLDEIAERLKETVKVLRDLISDFIQWWKNLFNQNKDSADEQPKLDPSSGKWSGIAQIIFWILSLFLIVLLIRAFLPRFRKSKPIALTAHPVSASKEPDVASETVNAADLESDEWEKLGLKLMQEGQFRLALRAFFLASLSFLGRREFLQLKRHKTNREYERELRRQVKVRPEILDRFAQNLALYERSWYGPHEATPEILQHFTENQHYIRHSLET